jgi:uncharacterized protein
MKNAMIWQLKKRESRVANYIFGTMHLGTIEAYHHLALAEKYIAQTALYAGEMNLDESNSTDLNSYFMANVGMSIKENFKPKRYQKYCIRVSKYFKLDLENYNHFSPFFINSMLTEAILPKAFPKALDHHLWEYARSAGKVMTGIETLAEQIHILQNIPNASQLKTFKQILGNVDSFRQNVLRINQKYKAADIKFLYKNSQRSMGKLRQLMIYERNEVMAARVLVLLDDLASFVAIGAAHLAGDKGILAILAKNGCQIKPVYF